MAIKIFVTLFLKILQIMKMLLHGKQDLTSSDLKWLFFYQRYFLEIIFFFDVKFITFTAIIVKLYYDSCTIFLTIFLNLSSDYLSVTNDLTGLIFRNDMSENMKDLTMTNKVQNLMIAPIEGIK